MAAPHSPIASPISVANPDLSRLLIPDPTPFSHRRLNDGEGGHHQPRRPSATLPVISVTFPVLPFLSRHRTLTLPDPQNQRFMAPLVALDGLDAHCRPNWFQFHRRLIDDRERESCGRERGWIQPTLCSAAADELGGGGCRG